MPYELPVSDDPLVTKALATIAKDFLGPLTAKKLGMDLGFHEKSQYRFSQIVKDLTGESPAFYILECRKAWAKEQILETNRPIEDIAEELGFTKKVNFSTWYANHLGIRPARHRAQGKAKAVVEVDKELTVNQCVSDLYLRLTNEFKELSSSLQVIHGYPYAKKTIIDKFRARHKETPKAYLRRIKLEFIARQIRHEGWNGVRCLEIMKTTRLDVLGTYFKQAFGMTISEFVKKNTLGIELQMNGELRYMTERTMNEIITHIAEDVLTSKQSVVDIRSFYEISPPRWSECFYQHTGMSGLLVQRALVMECALYLLETTDMSIGRIYQITAMTGELQWKENFQKYFGLSVLDVRASAKRVKRRRNTEQFKGIAAQACEYMMPVIREEQAA